MALAGLVHQCDTGQVEASCPIIRALARNESDFYQVKRVGMLSARRREDRLR